VGIKGLIFFGKIPSYGTEIQCRHCCRRSQYLELLVDEKNIIIFMSIFIPVALNTELAKMTNYDPKIKAFRFE